MDLPSISIVTVIGALWVAYTFLRKIQIENVLKERAKWREDVRELTKQIVANSNKEDVAKLEVKLNPLKQRDREIIESAKKATQNPDEFTFKVAKLLKHDWERAKKETDFLGFLKVINEAEIRNAQKDSTDIKSSKFCPKRIGMCLAFFLALPWIIEAFFYYLKFVQCFFVNL